MSHTIKNLLSRVIGHLERPCSCWDLLLAPCTAATASSAAGPTAAASARMMSSGASRTLPMILLHSPRLPVADHAAFPSDFASAASLTALPYTSLGHNNAQRHGLLGPRQPLCGCGRGAGPWGSRGGSALAVLPSSYQVSGVQTYRWSPNPCSHHGEGQCV